jgi:release factor glutamine methyltransferase
LLFLFMLNDHATFKALRSFLQREISAVYPEGETSSMIRAILEHFGYSSLQSMRDPGKMPGPETVTQIKEIVKEIHTHRPIQYILGQTGFCGLRIGVNEHVLIPRPETEELVERIIREARLPVHSILDLGTGSGCIALALKKAFPAARVRGLDCSEPALNVARKNGEENGLELEWVQGDIMDPLSWGPAAGYDLIVSNPPYVLNREQAMMHRNVLDFEPPEALFVDDHDPLKFCRAIARGAAGYLSPSGVLWLEINEQLGPETARLMEQHGFSRTTIIKDIHEKDRYIRAGR